MIWSILLALGLPLVPSHWYLLRPFSDEWRFHDYDTPHEKQGVVGILKFSYNLPVISGAGIKLNHSIKVVVPYNYFY